MRELSLKREPLSELSEDQMARVAGARSTDWCNTIWAVQELLERVTAIEIQTRPTQFTCTG